MQEHGDRGTRFEAVAALVTEPVRRFLARRTDRDTADDVLAETLLVCWRRLDDVPEGDEALPWAYAVARGQLANAERSARRRQRLTARISIVDPPPTVVPSTEEPEPRVHEALARMRPDDAEILRLWAWEELGATEIAVVLGITSNAASIRLHRAREKFARIYRETKDPARIRT